ncbi:MAG TPA: hypothetical protein VKS21_01065 [Spirochaetota bacterium]|nr:hypothetical protein [Spirochaetota bacterium]
MKKILTLIIMLLLLTTACDDKTSPGDDNTWEPVNADFTALTGSWHSEYGDTWTVNSNSFSQSGWLTMSGTVEKICSVSNYFIIKVTNTSSTNEATATNTYTKIFWRNMEQKGTSRRLEMTQYYPNTNTLSNAVKYQSISNISYWSSLTNL